MSELSLEETPIPGLLVVRLPLHADGRGWFKENWQRRNMTALGLPDFGPVQNNVAFNVRRGVTRGIHAEPWDKYVSVASGSVFGAWVDLRDGPTFGATFHLKVDPDVAVFVPRGVGNSYQAMEDATTYIYLVNDHWRAGAAYPALALDDPASAIPWPVPLDHADVSEKDRHNPTLDAVQPMAPKAMLILGADGQLGRALACEFPSARAVPRAILDVTEAAAVHAWPWHDYGTVLNAAAYTAVDAAETAEGRRAAWQANAVAVSRLAMVSREHRLTLVHFSSDYVFDGTAASYDETAPLSPLGVYGQSKAAGDVAVGTCPRHYLVRTSWVIGEGHNFVRTMQRLAQDGVSPSVVADQLGRLTFTQELARAVRHLLDSKAAFGTYNVTNDGSVTSWADVACRVFEHFGRPANQVRRVSTEAYAAGRVVAPRPARSLLDLSKLRASGFEPEDAGVALDRYLAGAGP